MKNTKKFGAFAAVAAAAMMCTCEAWAITATHLTGRHEVDGSALWQAVGDIGKSVNTVVHQAGYSVYYCNDNDRWFGYDGAVAAYLLDGGVLTNKNNMKVCGSYGHFRQTGGLFYRTGGSGFKRTTDQNTDEMLPFDIVFGGNAVATNLVNSLNGDRTIAVMDNAQVSLGTVSGTLNGMYKTMICANGGDLWGGISVNSFTNIMHSFNGGARRADNNHLTYGSFSIFGNNNAVAQWNKVYVRVYEKGGAISYSYTSGTSSGHYGRIPNLREPIGNVVWSVELTDDVRTNGGDGWDVPPAVVIKDANDNAGSNAVAIVDYDYENRAVTNVTILSRGENYSGTPGAVTAEFRYKATGEAIRTATCTVGPCQGGDFTFGGRFTFTTFCYGTNTYHGATIVDMDPEGFRENDKTEKDNLYRGGTLWPESGTRFFNTEKIVLKSGNLYPCYQELNVIFPDLKEMEIYGGHYAHNYRIASKVATVRDLTIGGSAILANRLDGDLGRIGVTGTVYVATACMTNGVTPSLTNGYLPVTGADMKIKDWSGLPRGRKVVALDLSGVSLTGTPTVVPSDDGIIEWKQEDQKLYARRHSDGLMLIFR